MNDKLILKQLLRSYIDRGWIIDQEWTIIFPDKNPSVPRTILAKVGQFYHKYFVSLFRQYWK